jgi:heterotetrameric sarcosine oxidase gamma subunit
MDRLWRSQPLAQCVPISRPTLTVQPVPQSTLSELRGGLAFREDPAYRQLPSEPGRSLDHGTWRANWLRPDGWLLIDVPQAAVPSETFTAAAQNRLCRLVDVSHSLAGISLRGAGARDLLARGTPLDLRQHAFGPGCCTRTRCADFTVMLDHRPDAIEVYVDASLAQAFWNWIADAAEYLRQ